MHGIEGAIIGGDFRVERLLGRGGMGAVYVALQLSTNRRRALKLMAPELTRDARSLERFAEEARVRARVLSPHIVETIAAGVDAQMGVPWLAMELLEGETLGARIERGRLSPLEASRVLGEIAAGLGAVHAAGIAHRDLKPENVFLATMPGMAPTVKILDFGVAKEIGASSSAPTQSVGSPAWMAPEQANGEPISPATDVWSFGLVAFFVLTGMVYWKAPREPNGTVTQLLREILLEDLPPASRRSPIPLPPNFDAWFARAVARDPGARFQDATVAWPALAPLMNAPIDLHASTFQATHTGNLTNGAVQLSTPPRRAGVPWPLFVVVSVLLLGLGSAGLFVALRRAQVSRVDASETDDDESPRKKRSKAAASETETPNLPSAPVPETNRETSPRIPSPQAHTSAVDPLASSVTTSADVTPTERSKFAGICRRCAENLPAGHTRTFTLSVTGGGSYLVTPRDARVSPCLVSGTSEVIRPERDKVKTFQCVAVGSNEKR